MLLSSCKLRKDIVNLLINATKWQFNFFILFLINKNEEDRL